MLLLLWLWLWISMILTTPPPASTAAAALATFAIRSIGTFSTVFLLFAWPLVALTSTVIIVVILFYSELVIVSPFSIVVIDCQALVLVDRR